MVPVDWPALVLPGGDVERAIPVSSLSDALPLVGADSTQLCPFQVS